jgi:hypothetical protein
MVLGATPCLAGSCYHRDPAARPGFTSAITRPAEFARHGPRIAGDWLNPSRESQIAALRLRLRRRRQLGDGCKGLGSVSFVFSRQCPSQPFSTSPRLASLCTQLTTADRLAVRTQPKTARLAPGFIRIAMISSSRLTSSSMMTARSGRQKSRPGGPRRGWSIG